MKTICICINVYVYIIYIYTHIIYTHILHVLCVCIWVDKVPIPLSVVFLEAYKQTLKTIVYMRVIDLAHRHSRLTAHNAKNIHRSIPRNFHFTGLKILL